MLDVHAPHEKIHGFRDFLLHLLTIIIGLLIAVGIEGCVESIHHRHLRNEADVNLRQELRDNQKELTDTRAAIAAEKQNLIYILKYLQARGAARPYELKDATVNFTLATLADANWSTASATGALSYMEYGHVQRYAAAYQLQAEYARLQTETVNEFLQLESYLLIDFDPATVTPEEARTLAPDVRKALAHLVAMEQIRDTLSKTYDQALAP